MTFLGLEKPVEQGRELVFDPVTALMVLNANRDYINAVYNEYQLAKEDMKEFNKEYGDFMSPIAKDMDWYAKNVTGNIRDFVNNLYAQGVDPLRSAEGRNLVARKLASIPTGNIAKVRLSAEAAKEYIKNRGALEAAGKWDPNFERFANNGQMLDDWDTINGGLIWTRTSPAEFKTLKEVTEDWYNNRTAHALDKAGVESFDMTYDPRYQYMGFTDNDLLDIAAGQTPGWNGSIYADYYRDVAKKMVAANKLLNGDNSPVTAEEVEKLLLRNVATANKEYLILPTKEADLFALDDHRTANDIRAARAKADIEFEYDKKRLTDPVFKAAAKGNGDESSGYNIAEDVYLTSLAKGSGVEYLPQGGVTPWMLDKMLKDANEKQNDAIRRTGNVLAATGMFISPEKIEGLILSDGKDGDGYLLNSGYLKNLHTIEDMRTSYKDWLHKGSTKQLSKDIRNYNKQASKDIVTALKEKIKGHSGYRVKVVTTTDDNGNNTYSMVGEDGRWHTYALARVYVKDGQNTVSVGDRSSKNYIPQSGKEIVVDLGLQSNVNAGSPDFSVSARENLGFYGFDATKDKIGMTGNTGWPYGTNILSH